MTEANSPAAPPEDLAELEQRVAQLAQQAEAAAQRYDRTAWVGYAGIFIAIPFLMLIFRAYMQAWHYYAAGALFLAGALLTYAMDLVAVTRRDQALEDAQRARQAYELARQAKRQSA